MTVLFDRFMAKHPQISHYFKRKVLKYFATGAITNIFCCLAVSAALGMIGDVYGGAFFVLALVTADIVWFQAALLAGFLRQWIFIPFAALFFLIPYGAADIFGSGFLYSLNSALAELSMLLVKYITGQAEIFGITGLNASALFTGITFVIFLLGLTLRSAAKKSDFYCKLRLEQMT